MKGIIKLRVPTIQVTPKLYIVIVNVDGTQISFEKVAYSLDDAFKLTWIGGRYITINDYKWHVALSVDEINNKFRAL